MLQSDRCFGCLDFGPFFNLYFCCRLCSACALEAYANQTICIADAKQNYGVDDARMKGIGRFLAVPRPRALRYGLYPLTALFVPKTIVCQPGTPRFRMTHELLHFPLDSRYGPPWIISSAPRSCDDMRREFSMEPLLRLPFIKTGTSIIDNGRRCIACNELKSIRGFCYKETSHMRLYTHQGYLVHLARCYETQAALATWRSHRSRERKGRLLRRCVELLETQREKEKIVWMARIVAQRPPAEIDERTSLSREEVARLALWETEHPSDLNPTQLAGVARWTVNHARKPHHETVSEYMQRARELGKDLAT